MLYSRSLFSLLVCLCFSTLAAETPHYSALPNETHVPILTPTLSTRETFKLRLSNGLEAYVISDPETSQAGAVLTVEAGSWDDPEEIPGLAHFLEHMLFLGTEKYPVESEYDHFIQSHNGETNAYTAPDYTLYLFSVNAPALGEALDRFSFFFKKPLFNPSGVSRELQAVNQEFVKNLDQEGFRYHSVLKEIANREHPFHRFSIGNASTLSEVTQSRLREWYEAHYSAHKMRLIVYGSQPLETLISWVIRDFKDIPSHASSSFTPSCSLFGEDLGGQLLRIQPLHPVKMLRLTWEIPFSTLPSSSFRPAAFINGLLGDEREGSLFSLLKAEGLAEGLSASDSRLSRDHFLFTLSIELTEKGLQQVPQVMEHAFQAIQLLQQQETFPPYLFEEAKRMCLVNYQYQSREDVYHTLLYLGGLLVYEKLDRFPECVLVPSEFDPEPVRQWLSHLTPERFLAVINAEDAALVWDRAEKWTGTPYTLSPIPSEQINRLSHLPPDPRLHLPLPNPFIPEHPGVIQPFSFLPENEASLFSAPQLLIDDEQTRLYFAEDRRFGLPKTMWFFEIKTPSIDANDPTSLMLTRLYIDWLEESLHPYGYPAHAAGLGYDISQTTNGLLITLSGYCEGAERLFDAILAHLKQIPPFQPQFERLKERLLTEYRLSRAANALQRGLAAYRSVLYTPSIPHQQRLEALQETSYEQFLSHIAHLYDHTYVQGVLYGAINPNDALRVYQKLQDRLESQPFPSDQHRSSGVVVLPNASGPYSVEISAPYHSHAAILAVEGGDFSFKIRAAQQILGQALHNAFYSALRTQQQTGYEVFAKDQEIDQHLFFLFAVQSSTHDPRDLLARFELFIEGFLQDMKTSGLTYADFERLRQALIDSLEHYPQNLSETGHLMKTLILDHAGNFDWLSQQIQGFKDITYEELLAMAQEWLGKQNKRRLAILVRGSTCQDLHYEPLPDPHAVRAVSQYTRMDEVSIP